MSREADMELVRKSIDSIAEHFDSVQIFVTRHEQGELDGTVNIQLGTGNWFTRYGQVEAWVVKTRESFRVDERKTEDEK